MTDTNPSASSGGLAHDLGKDSSSRDENQVGTANDIEQKLSDDVHSATEFARKELSGVSEQAKEAADGQKNIIAGKMSGVALAIGKVADELERGDDPELGKLARNIGTSMKKFSDDIQDRSLGEIAGMAEDFGRKQPLAFLGVAAIAGLAASRFLTASARSGTPSTAKKPADRMSSNSTSTDLAPSTGLSLGHNASEGRTNG